MRHDKPQRSLEAVLRNNRFLSVVVNYEDAEQPFFDETIIDTNANSSLPRLSGLYDPYDEHKFPPLEKSLIDVDLSMHKNIDTIRLDCEKLTPFVLESLRECIERYQPLIIVNHNDSHDRREVWNIIGKHYYCAPTQIELAAVNSGTYYTYMSMTQSESNYMRNLESQ